MEDHEKKRKAVSNDAENNAAGDTKRPRVDEEEEQEDRILPSARQFLEVPIEYIFRQVPSGGVTAASGFATQQQSTTAPSQFSLSSCTPNNNNAATAAAGQQQQRLKPLLSRSEAQLLLHVNLIAHEIDSLTDLATTTLRQRLQCSEFCQLLETADHPFFRPLLSILRTLHQQGPDSTLRWISSDLQTALFELQTAVTTLCQSSEQNWNVSERLQDTGGLGLSREMRRLSDMQEELRQRISMMLNRESAEPAASVVQEDATATDDDTMMVSMKEYCARIFDDALPSNNRNAPSQDDTSPQQSERLQSARKNLEDDDEYLEEPMESALSAVTTPDPSQQHLTSPDVAEETPAVAATAAAAATSSTKRNSNHLLGQWSAAASASRSTPAASRSPPSSSSFQPQRLMDSSSSSKRRKTADAACEGKENAPSQTSSSSQRSTPQQNPLLPAAIPVAGDDDGHDTDCFRSQSAAEVLAGMTTAGVGWQRPAKGSQESASPSQAQPNEP